MFLTDPPQKVLITGPSSIRAHNGHKEVSVTCQSDVGNPAAELTYKVFANTANNPAFNILDNLVADRIAELKESKTTYVDRQQHMTEDNNSGRNMGWITSREMLIKPNIVKSIKSNQIVIQCSTIGSAADDILIKLIRKSARPIF